MKRSTHSSRVTALATLGAFIQHKCNYANYTDLTPRAFGTRLFSASRNEPIDIETCCCQRTTSDEEKQRRHPMVSVCLPRPSVACLFKYASLASTRSRIHSTRRCARTRERNFIEIIRIYDDEKENGGEERSREVVVALFYWILDVSVDFSVADENDRSSPSTPMATLAIVIPTSPKNTSLVRRPRLFRFRCTCQRYLPTVSMPGRQGEISCTSIFKYDEPESSPDRQRHE